MKNIAIVTGASSGIGKEFFLSLNNKKAELDEIWVVARSEDKLQALQAQTEIPIRVFPLDLSTMEATQRLEETFETEKPSIRYLICASGFGRFSAIADDDNAVLQNMVDLNCRSIVGVTRAAYPYMAKGGLVMLVASVAAFQPIPYIATYAASKAFVLSYGRALNKELQKTNGARCLCVCPFWTKTAFFDRAISPDEKTVVKKYVAMYTPDQIVKRAWKDAKKKRRDISICGVKAKGQTLLVKLLPHKLVMKVWMSQQKLN
ncbi:MAG: SDR family NAD(P)-dependent oxidoreductase [Clostridia bacterium]|nr:SDR family NAD(P)-dependent oxidoreductase [Clostridia bacterium]